ncbi:mannitol dehydrogenase family protein [Kibdelosporangium persicum]|uniref:Fructuronate reductase UxuB n=1 Tax=Kibdelosporangium persicum TaxID=2698649 RepID=A0ABX2F8F0_9PSEU|nr:mannitol dehydrogenase family protein [Kibdelosporangium persicum]NRN67250.1 Fructuronate reductase UxuB [Kibdelosporangium persicum]
MTQRLSRSAWTGAGPAGGIGIVHLGLGAFHRAHQAVFTQEAMRAEPGDWGICAVSQRSPAVRDALAAQDCLFTVTERDADTDHVRVVDSVREVLLAPAEPDRLTTVLASPDTHVVTITVTESGYRHDLVTGHLRADDPEVAADLAGRPPHTLAGQLIRGLRTRRAAGVAGLTVLSCDNLPDNGPLVARLVLDFCALSGESGLAGWIAGNVRFPSTVVDQIVPATTEDDIARVTSRLGLLDRGAVVGETYRNWVIEDDFAAGRPAWDRVGVRLVPDIAAHQAAKLRLVNGTHSAFAYLGTLAGCRTTAEVAARPEFVAYAERLLRNETGASLVRFGQTVGDAEIEALLHRLANPRITHQLPQIAADGLRKLPQRLLDPAAELLGQGTAPRMICLALAGFLRCQGQTVESLLGTRPALRDFPDFRRMIAEADAQIARHGVPGVMATFQKPA